MGEAQQAVPPARVRSVPFSDDFVTVIAETIDAHLDLAPFQLPGAKVYQLLIHGEAGRTSTMVTLWPSLRRIDAIGSGSAIVFTRVASVQLVDGVEILFRRDEGEYLIIAKGGKLIVRC
jgi:hypothetical protein